MKSTYKNLFICDTPFHVLTSLLIGQNHNYNGTSDIILTDNMSGASLLADKLSQSSLASHVYVANTKHVADGSIANGFEYLFDLLLPFSSRWDCPIADESYNALYVRNYMDPIAISAFSYFKAKNKDLNFIVYDEGYSSYSREFWFDNQNSLLHKFAGFMARNCFGKQDTFTNITHALFYAPDFLEYKLPFSVSPLLPLDFHLDNDFLTEINHIFGFDPALFEEIIGNNLSGKKYVFFEESFANDRGNQADLKILDDLAVIVGKENIYIKLHPRSVVDRFTPRGYKVLDVANYPWEVCALNAPQNCPLTLISFSSGSLLNYHFMCEHKMKSVFLYELYPNACQTMSDDVKRFFAKFIECYPDGVNVPKTKAELREALV